MRPDDLPQHGYETSRKSVTIQNALSSNADPWFGIKPTWSSQIIRISKFEKIKWQRSVFNPQKSLWPESKYNLQKVSPFNGDHRWLSLISVTILHRSNLVFQYQPPRSSCRCHQGQTWCRFRQGRLQVRLNVNKFGVTNYGVTISNHAILSHLAGFAFWLMYLYIYSGNTFQYIL